MPRIAIAIPLAPDLVESIQQSLGPIFGDNSGYILSYHPELLPEQRFAGDYAGDPGFQRSHEQQKQFWQMLLQAEIVLGFPDESVAGLKKLLSESTQLRWVQSMRAGAGESVLATQLEAKDLARVQITTAAGVHARPLAEFALMGILQGFKNVPLALENQQKKLWPELRTPVRLAQGSSLVIAGLGEIGQKTAELASGLGMIVRGTKRTPEPLNAVHEVAAHEKLAELVSQADAVVSALPGTKETAHTFDDAMFSAFKPGTVFVNIGRGSAVDEAALLRALDSGQVSFACLDVFEHEPLPQSSPLWEHPRVMVFAHTSALNSAEPRLIVERFVENLARYAAGTSLIHPVDIQASY